MPPTFVDLSPCPLTTTAARLHSPPLFSVQQVARSFKTCRRSFVRFKKPKHRQSSALRRQDRYPHRKEVRGAVGWREAQGGRRRGVCSANVIYQRDTVYARVLSLLTLVTRSLFFDRSLRRASLFEFLPDSRAKPSLTRVRCSILVVSSARTHRCDWHVGPTQKNPR